MSSTYATPNNNQSIHISDATGPWALYSSSRRRWLLFVLFLVSTSNYLDRHVVAVLLEPIKREFGVSDTMLGLLSGFCFALFYAVAGMPVARWADRANRRTIISLAVATWSVMTVLCGFAQTFWQLALARVGVGAGESGAIPAAQSLISEYFPPSRRASALAIFTAAGSAGYLLGLGLGGYIASRWGWRVAFIFLGAPGLVLALIAQLSLAEPRLNNDFQMTFSQVESLSDAIVKLRRKRSFIFALAASVTYFIFAYGVVIFIPSFLIRVLGASMAKVSISYGAVTAVGTVLGTLSGGWVTDYFARRSVRWIAWVPSIAFLAAAPLFMVAFSVNSLSIFLMVALVAYALIAGGIPAIWAAVHAICGSARRATAIATVLFSSTLFGGGLGPLATGALSDLLSGMYGPAGLRYSLMTMTSMLILSGVLCHVLGRNMLLDLED